MPCVNKEVEDFGGDLPGNVKMKELWNWFSRELWEDRQQSRFTKIENLTHIFYSEKIFDLDINTRDWWQKVRVDSRISQHDGRLRGIISFFLDEPGRKESVLATRGDESSPVAFEFINTEPLTWETSRLQVQTISTSRCVIAKSIGIRRSRSRNTYVST